MVTKGGNGIDAAPQAPPANPIDGPDATRVAREFVRQYYTILHSSPIHLHRFYNDESEFIHGSIDTPSKSVRGQQDIHRAIMGLNFRECYAKIHYVDAQESENKMVVVQVAGQLTNQGGPMRRFMQTFILVQLSARKYYVRNDIFRYQDQVFEDEEDGEDVSHKVSPADDQAHEQPIFNGGAGVNDCVTINGEHAPEPVSTVKDDNQWDNSMAAQTPAAEATQNASQPQTNLTAPATAAVSTQGVARETSNASSAPRSWSQMLQVKKASEPVSPPANSQPSFGPPTNSTTTFGGSIPSQNLNQRPLHRGNNNRANGSNTGPTPPKKDSQAISSMHSRDDSETSPNSNKSFMVPDNQQLFVGNIPTNVSEKALIELFSKYGKVNDFRLSTSKSVSGTAGVKGNNFGFVIFESPETVQKVLEESRNDLFTWEIDGKQIRLNIEEKKPRALGPKGARGLNNGQRGPDRRPIPNGGGNGRREFNGRPPRSGPPRQSSGTTGQNAPAHHNQQQQQAQQA